MSVRSTETATNVSKGLDKNATQKDDCLKSITELKKANKKIFSNLKLMHDKVQLHDETTKIQFQLLQKEFQESKGEAERKNHLLISLFQKLHPEFKTLSTLEEMIFVLQTRKEDTKDVKVRDRATLQKQNNDQLYQQQHNQEHLQTRSPPQLELYHHNHHMNLLKEEVDDIKGKEHFCATLTLETEYSCKDYEEGSTTQQKLGPSSYHKDNAPVYNASETRSMKENELLQHHFLPSDTYSYFAVADYLTRGNFSVVPVPTTAFSIASFTLSIQLITLSIFIMDVVDYKNKANPISVPPAVSIQVRLSQLIALLISCWNQDEVRESFNVLSLGYRKETVRAISSDATWYKWYFSIFIRIVVGWFSLVVTFILIVNSDTVRDVMLDFAAVTFVSELDNGVFQLSLWGYMGKSLQRLTMKVKNIPVREKTSSTRASKRKRKVPRLVWLLIVIGLVTGFWAWVTIKQERGDYLDQSILVQFGDDFSPAMGAFSGIYEIKLDHTIDGMRVNYVELGDKSDGRFSYCSQDRRWIFQYGSDPEGYGEHLFSECWHKARSSKTSSYDLTETTSITWFVLDENLAPLENPLQHFLVKSQPNYYGKSCKSEHDCGERMHCNYSENKCVCDDGLFGFNCNFRKPCETLEIDSRDRNGFSGTRLWSRRYSSLSENPEKGKGNNNTSPIQVYGKPVYVGDESIEGIFDVMIFTGRRWILTDSLSIKDYHNVNMDDDSEDNNKKAKRNLAEYLANSFHAYWSNYTYYFASEPVDVGTPADSATPVGLQWFRLEAIGTEGVSLRSGEEIWQGSMAIEAKLLCAVCNNDTNPCFYGAICQADGTCDCTTGSSGRICQIPPDNNGNCDVFFNTPEFAFDGGDCCKETCVSTRKYSCGKGLLENSAGVSAYGFIGYPNCLDPRFKSKLAGSKTLYEIVERGFVRCGSELLPGFVEISEDGKYSGFEVDLCKAVAAAALGDPEAIEMVNSNWSDRWDDLAGGKFDLLLSGITYTAERDVFQSAAKTGFSFARITEIFDGLRYAGIPPYTDCADKLDVESTECINLRICVTRGTTWYDVTERLFPDSMIVAVNSFRAEVHGLEAGVCNVIAGESVYITEFAVRDIGFTGPYYTLGKNMYSKEPLSAATRQADRIWSKFVSWTFESLVQAEESGISQFSAEAKIAQTDVFGELFKNMFRNAVAANGNYGEIYDKNLGGYIPRGGLNTVNTGSSGLIYSFPFGAVETRGNDPSVGGTLEAIKRRGVLNCGIANVAGFGALDPLTGRWEGFEVDMCRGIAAALFNGSPNVNFIPLTSLERFSALAYGTVDIMNCVTTHTLSREMQEVTTGQGFDFTPPTFYDGLGFAGRPLYVGCAEMRMFENNGDDCSNTRICVIDGTTSLDTLMGPLEVPAENVVVLETKEDVYFKFISGECNVIAGESLLIMESSVRKFGLAEDEDYIVGAFKYSKEPLAIVSRSDDAQFSDFLRWIVFGFFHAEEMGITKNEYFDMPINNLFGRTLSDMWQHAIQTVGNHGEIYARNFEGILDRGGPNTLNDNNGPQFLAMPGVMIN